MTCVYVCMGGGHEKRAGLSQEINHSFVVQEGLVEAAVLDGLVVTAVAVVSAYEGADGNRENLTIKTINAPSC